MNGLSLARLTPGILLLLILTGCASTPLTDRLLEHRPAEIKAHSELDSLSFFPQQQYQCGPAALATMLDFQGINITPDELVGKVYLPQRQGSLQLEMIATARQYGLLAYKLDPGLDTIMTAVAHGHPVLVFQNLSFSFWPQWHYAVVAGYDLDRQEIILRSGTIKQHSLSFHTFERTWQRAGHWAYILLKPGVIPQSAKALKYTQAAHELSESGFRNDALISYRAAAKKWPRDTVTTMILGNAEYTAGNLLAAENSFRQSIENEPLHADAWNNLAYVLAARGCPTTARQAINCALTLSPDNNNIRQSYKELIGQLAVDSAECMPIICPQNR
ncbi:MAG: PA2778 family cysteine peptidase [Gammaproteobacteria bacterium]|nr:PA2778 family cysteine peptidase [Gammaproteobacteria bacterium]